MTVLRVGARATFVIVVAAALVLAACGGDDGGEPASSQSATPQPSITITTPAPQGQEGCSTDSPEWSTGKILAYRLLLEDDQAPLLDATELDDLSRELDAVLGSIQAAYPDVPAAKALFDYVPARVTVGFEETFANTLPPALWNSNALVSPITFGREDLDQLNEQLGLRALVYPTRINVGTGSSVWMALCLSDLTNPPAAAEEFAAIPVVTYAKPDLRAGDGSDTAVAEQGDEWYVVIRDASGDCPAGCTEQQLYYFVVSDSTARRVEESEAQQDSLFSRLARTWNPATPTDSPAPSESPAP